MKPARRHDVLHWIRAIAALLLLALASCAWGGWSPEGGGGDGDGGAPAGDGDPGPGDGDPLPGDGDPGPGDAACLPATRILTAEVSNARDLGGTPLGDGERVACGRLYRGAVLANLTEAGCAEFARLGIRTVIDLRTESECLSAPDPDCVVEQARIVLAPMPTPYSVSPADYIADMDARASLAAAFAAFGDPAAYPIYNHCVYGRDRTGVLSALVLLALGAGREDIVAEYQLTAEAGLTTFPASLEAVLDEVERRGGIEAVLEEAGVTTGQLEVLRAQAAGP